VTDRERVETARDRLIFLAEALTLVPFSETTLRRAIARGELEAWQPNRDGKLVMWRSTLIAWATRRPAAYRRESGQRHTRATARPSSRPQRRTAAASQSPDAITLSDLA
jgi:hypothetical protein